MRDPFAHDPTTRTLVELPSPALLAAVAAARQREALRRSEAAFDAALDDVLDREPEYAAYRPTPSPLSPPAPAVPTTNGPPVASAAYLVRVEDELLRQRATRDARRRLDAEDRGPVALPEILTLRERLARPRVTLPPRITGWQPAGSRIMLAAQFKAGKTTLVGNRLRCLVDDEPFLGGDSVTPLDGTAVLIDAEMDPGQLDDWLRALRIRHDHRLLLIPLRGTVRAFDILSEEGREGWATRLRALDCEDLTLDCLRPVLDAFGLDEHRDAGRFLVAFDQLLVEAGIRSAAVVQHMGHAGERSRGDSRLRDWPDAEWRLVRQDDDPASPRFLSAYGRDVYQPECQLAYDAATRRLTRAGGSRKDARAAEDFALLLPVLETAPQPLSVREIERAARTATDVPRDRVRDAIKYAVRAERLRPIHGPKGAILHAVCERAEACGQRAAHGASGACERAAPFIGAAHSAHTPDPDPPKDDDDHGARY